MQQQPRMVRDYHDWRASRQPPGATLCSLLAQAVRVFGPALYRATRATEPLVEL